MPGPDTLDFARSLRPMPVQQCHDLKCGARVIACSRNSVEKMGLSVDDRLVSSTDITCAWQSAGANASGPDSQLELLEQVDLCFVAFEPDRQRQLYARLLQVTARCVCVWVGGVVGDWPLPLLLRRLCPSRSSPRRAIDCCSPRSSGRPRLPPPPPQARTPGPPPIGMSSLASQLEACALRCPVRRLFEMFLPGVYLICGPIVCCLGETNAF